MMLWSPGAFPWYLRVPLRMILVFERGPQPPKPVKPKKQPPVVGAGWLVFPVPWYLRWMLLLSSRPFRRP